MISTKHPYYKPIADIIEHNRNGCSSGEIAIMILEFFEARDTEEYI